MSSRSHFLEKRYIAGGIAAILVFAAIPVMHSVTVAAATSYRDNLDVFLDAVNVFEMIPLFPVVIIVIVGLPFSQRVGERNLVNEQLRYPIRPLLRAYLLRGCILAVLVMAAYAVAAGIWAFDIAPHTGIYHIDPHAYGITAAQAASDALSRTTFSGLLRFGAPVFIGVYGAWMGVNAACFAAMSLASVLLIRQRILALLAPWLLYIGQTILAAAAGVPALAMAYDIFPAGLQPISTGALITPLLLFSAAAMVAWGLLMRTPERAVGLT